MMNQATARLGRPMLTVKGKTIVFMTAADLEDANKTHQTAQKGPAGQKTHKAAGGSRQARPPGPELAEGRNGASDVGPASQLAAVVTLLNDADHKLSQARQLIAEAFDILGRIEE